MAEEEQASRAQAVYCLLRGTAELTPTRLVLPVLPLRVKAKCSRLTLRTPAQRRLGDHSIGLVVVTASQPPLLLIPFSTSHPTSHSAKTSPLHLNTHASSIARSLSIVTTRPGGSRGSAGATGAVEVGGSADDVDGERVESKGLEEVLYIPKV